MANFEKYVKEKRRSYKTPGATVTKLGTIVFNSSCSEVHVGDSVSAELYFDRGEKAIGVKFFKEERLEGYKVQRRAKGRMTFVSPRGFLTYFDIPHASTCAFPVEWDESEQMLIIRLAK